MSFWTSSSPFRPFCDLWAYSCPIPFHISLLLLFPSMQAASSLWTLLKHLSGSCLSVPPGVWLCMQPLKLNQTGTFVPRWWKVTCFDSCCHCVRQIKAATLRQIRHFPGDCLRLLRFHFYTNLIFLHRLPTSPSLPSFQYINYHFTCSAHTNRLHCKREGKG